MSNSLTGKSHIFVGDFEVSLLQGYVISSKSSTPNYTEIVNFTLKSNMINIADKYLLSFCYRSAY